jgi:hypothetical protein
MDHGEEEMGRSLHEAQGGMVKPSDFLPNSFHHIQSISMAQVTWITKVSETKYKFRFKPGQNAFRRVWKGSGITQTIT